MKARFLSAITSLIIKTRKCRVMVVMVGLLISVSNISFAIPAPPADGWQNADMKVAGKDEGAPVDEGTFSRGLTVNQDDITPGQDESKIALTAEQQHQAAVWQLTPEQEQRYVFLMQNKSGVFYAGKNLSPVWILGLNARTDAERAYYANLAAKQEEQYIVQNLAWETAFHQAIKTQTQGLPVVKPFDTSAYSPLTRDSVKWQAHDVVNYFINPAAPVGNALITILTEQKKESTIILNLYFVGHPSDADIQAWANHQSLPVEWVKAGRITLNQGDTLFDSIHLPNKKVPLILLVRHGQSIPLDSGVL